MEKLESEMLENPLSVDTDSKTQVVGWDNYIDLDKNNTKQGPNTYNSPIKNGSAGNVFDSLFTNSFLSPLPSIVSPQPVISTKPKRNILGTKKSTLKKTSTASAAAQGRENPPPTASVTMKLVKIKATITTKTSTKTVTFSSRGTNTDSMATPADNHPNSSMAEIFKESKSFKDELMACEQSDMKKNKSVSTLTEMSFWS